VVLSIVLQRVNTVVRVYENFTPGGLHFHLSYKDGVCYIILRDLRDSNFEMHYFTNITQALRYINNI
jgi:hypothetical protein